jgi:hypothetical protein
MLGRLYARIQTGKLGVSLADLIDHLMSQDRRFRIVLLTGPNKRRQGQTNEWQDD